MTAPPYAVRRRLEGGLRVLAILVLLLALVRMLTPARDGRARLGGELVPPAVLFDTTAQSLARLLAQYVIATAPGDSARLLALNLTQIPPARARALLGTLVTAHRPVQWEDHTLAKGLALSLTRVPGPTSEFEARVSTGWPSDSVGRVPMTVRVRDMGGTLDSLPLTHDGVLGWRFANASPPLSVSMGGSTATADVVSPAVATRRVLLIAQPGWEAKFVSAALEEAGWVVDGRLRISPKAETEIGTPQRLDVSRYGVVVVLDSLSVDGPSLKNFVTRGGGLVLSGDALRVPGLRELNPVRASARRGAVAGALLSGTPRHGLEAWEIEAVRGATILQADDADHGHIDPVLVAQRVGAGRVVASAYRNSWRWRMEGTDNGAAEHRVWWNTALTLSVAGDVGSERSVADGYPGDAAPYADLVARVGTATGPARTAVRDARAGSLTNLLGRISPGVLMVVFAAALCGEWASRRLRGVP